MVSSGSAARVCRCQERSTSSNLRDGDHLADCPLYRRPEPVPRLRVEAAMCLGGPGISVTLQGAERVLPVEQWRVAAVEILALCGGAPKLRTDAELEKLKRDWLADPCWDIEETGGFEAHRHELTAFRLRQVIEWRSEAEKQADRLGVTQLGLSTIRSMERRIAALEEASNG